MTTTAHPASPAGNARPVTVACIQMACSWNLPDNVDRAERRVRAAAAEGAQIILLQELFEAPYFCIEQSEKHYALATTLEAVSYTHLTLPTILRV